MRVHLLKVESYEADSFPHRLFFSFPYWSLFVSRCFEAHLGPSRELVESCMAKFRHSSLSKSI